jgi:hypothetical protein
MKWIDLTGSLPEIPVDSLLSETRRGFFGLSFFGSRRRCESARYIIRNSAWRWNLHASRMDMTPLNWGANVVLVTFSTLKK